MTIIVHIKYYNDHFTGCLVELRQLLGHTICRVNICLITVSQFIFFELSSIRIKISFSRKFLIRLRRETSATDLSEVL